MMANVWRQKRRDGGAPAPHRGSCLGYCHRSRPL